MRAITPIQSELLSCEILAQARRLNDMVDHFALPWGALSKHRVARLYRERIEILECARGH